jgi:hypothetical protein
MKPAGSKPPLWQCPRCGHRFVTANMWHSCGHYRLADHFDGKPQILRETFDRYVAAARAFGPVTVYAQKTRIVMQGRVRFAGAVVRKNWLDASMWLKRRVSHPRLVRSESFGPLGYGHHFRLCSPGDIDKALIKLLEEAYSIGQQEPLGKKAKNWWSERAKSKAQDV